MNHSFLTLTSHLYKHTLSLLSLLTQLFNQENKLVVKFESNKKQQQQQMGGRIKGVEEETVNIVGVGSATKLRALVVDDNKVNQTIHHRLLDNLGIENQVVVNGKEAVDVHSSGKYFDLILMDMDMPVMNGIEATKKLRAMGIRSTIAGVSTRSQDTEKREFMEAGLDDYHEKPLTTAKLVSILHKINHSG